MAVVAHADVLHAILSSFAPSAPPQLQEGYTRIFQNCELRSFVLSDGGMSSPNEIPDSTYFPGGYDINEPMVKNTGPMVPKKKVSFKAIGMAI